MIAHCGLAGVGKSVFGYTLALALGSGTQFMNRPTTASRVLYLDEENGHRDRRAYVYRAWVGLGRPNREILDGNVAIHGFALSTCDGQWDRQLLSLTETIKPHLIVIDTATPACRIKDENSNGEAAQAAQKLRGICNSGFSGCSMIVMKHLRIDPKTGAADMRGAKAWKGSVDAIWYHRRPQGRPRKDGLYKSYLRPEKVRAFGLRTEIEIDPARIEGENGLVLNARDKEVEDKKTGFDEL